MFKSFVYIIWVIAGIINLYNLIFVKEVRRNKALLIFTISIILISAYFIIEKWNEE